MFHFPKLNGSYSIASFFLTFVKKVPHFLTLQKNKHTRIVAVSCNYPSGLVPDYARGTKFSPS